jgi:hypothetical protein
MNKTPSSSSASGMVRKNSTSITSVKPVEYVPQKSSNGVIRSQPSIDPNDSRRYTLSHAASMATFFIHSAEAANYISQIEEQIKQEYMLNRNLVCNQKCPPVLDSMIYGLYSERDSKFTRVRLTSKSQANYEHYLAFFLDYGYIKQV